MFNSLRDYVDPENLKSVFNKVQAAVYNYTEYQAKVMEATNNDKWGASGTLMTDIAQATNSPMHLNDIMVFILFPNYAKDTLYKKFAEKGDNWRQCYKALQLLEYLIKNGSERVVDNAKDHIYELKTLTRFQFGMN
jgi:epsin